MHDLTRLDERPRTQPRLGGPHPRGKAVQPTASNTTVTQSTTSPLVTEQLRRKRGRPRKVVSISDAGPDILPMSHEGREHVAPPRPAVDLVQRDPLAVPALAVTPAAVLSLPRSQATPKAARMRVVHEAEVASTDPAYYRHLLLNSTDHHH